MADIFDRVDSPHAVKSPFMLDLRDGTLKMALGGQAVDLRLVQRIVITVDAETMLPAVRLEFIPTALNVALSDVQVGAVLVPLEKSTGFDFANQVTRVVGLGLPPGPGPGQVIAVDTASQAKVVESYETLFPLKVGPQRFPATRVGVLDAFKAYLQDTGSDRIGCMEITPAIEAAFAGWDPNEYGGRNLFKDGGRPPAMFGVPIRYDAEKFLLRGWYGD